MSLYPNTLISKLLGYASFCFVFLFVSTLISFAPNGFAESPSEPAASQEIASEHAHWIFSGMVTAEDSCQYGYLFQMRREGNQFSAEAAIIDAQNGNVLMHEENSAVLEHPEQLKWQVGRAFLTFNAITESWVFGLSPKDQIGFNFKVDMLSQSDSKQRTKNLRAGIKLVVNQTGHINGHILLGKDAKEQFVTSNNTWYRKIWLSEKQSGNHLLSSLLCRFDDGSGFYSVNMKEEDADEGAITGMCDAKGKASVFSQFIDVHEQADKNWKISIPSPEMHIEVSNSINRNSLIAGFIKQGAKEGFCVFCQQALA